MSCVKEEKKMFTRHVQTKLMQISLQMTQLGDLLQKKNTYKIQTNKKIERKVNIFLSISLNISFGCSKELPQ